MSETPMKKKALLIGINEYQILPELKYARQDAEAVEQALKQNYGFSDDEIVLLTDAKPGMFKPINRLVIEKHLEKLADQELDLFIFGFWGHGLFRNGQRYFCPLDAIGDEIEKLGLPFDALQRFLSNIKAKNTCLILDCCQKIHDRGESETLTAVDQTAMENAARDIVFKRQEKEPEFQSNVAILNSCKEGQAAYEWDNRQHGIFTAHLLDALNRRFDSVAQIVGYISKNVEKTAMELGKTQTPFYKLEGDIALPVDTHSVPLITGDVFISYRHCNADLVVPVEEELKRRGISYFIDRVGVNYGMEYSDALTRALAACKLLLLFWTPEVKGSEDIINEVVLAQRLKKIVIPYKIGNFSEIEHSRLCYHIARLSYYEVPRQSPETVKELVNRIEQALTGRVISSNPEPSNPEPSNPEPSNPEPSIPVSSNPAPSKPALSNQRIRNKTDKTAQKNLTFLKNGILWAIIAIAVLVCGIWLITSGNNQDGNYSKTADRTKDVSADKSVNNGEDFLYNDDVALSNDNQYDEATSKNEDAVSMRPENKDYQAGKQTIESAKAEELKKQKEKEELLAAKSELERQTEANQIYKSAVKLRGDEQYEQALVKINEALAMYPKDAEFNNEKQTIESLLAESKRQAKADSLYKEAISFRNSQKYDEALSKINEALSMYPNNSKLKVFKQNLDKSIAEVNLQKKTTAELEQVFGMRNEEDLFFARRSGKARAVAMGGGATESERAVALGLQWISNHQLSNGSWSFNHHLALECRGSCKNPGKQDKAIFAATGLALLPFLGAGVTHQELKYKTNVYKGITYLCNNGKHTIDDCYDFTEEGSTIDSHGIVTLCLTEAYGMTKDEKLLPVAQGCLNFIYKHQNADGGWRYQPRQPGDESALGWQISAIRVGYLSGLDVPKDVVGKASQFIDSVQSASGSQDDFTKSGVSPSSVSIGLLSCMRLGCKHNSSARSGMVVQNWPQQD